MDDPNLPRHIIQRFERRWALQHGELTRTQLFGRPRPVKAARRPIKPVPVKSPTTAPTPRLS